MSTTDSANLQTCADSCPTIIWLLTGLVFVLAVRWGQETWNAVRYCVRSRSLKAFVAFALASCASEAWAANVSWPGCGGITWMTVVWNGVTINFTYQGNNTWTGVGTGNDVGKNFTLVTDAGGGMGIVDCNIQDNAAPGNAFAWVAQEPPDPSSLNIADVLAQGGLTVTCSNSGTDANCNQVGVPCWGGGGGGGSCPLPTGFPAAITFHFLNNADSPPQRHFDLEFGDLGGGQCGWKGGSPCSNSYKIVAQSGGWHLRGPGLAGVDMDVELTASTNDDPSLADWGQFGLMIDCKGAFPDLDCDGLSDAEDGDVDGDGFPASTDCNDCDATRHTGCPNAACGCKGGDFGSSSVDPEYADECPQLSYCEFTVCKLDNSSPPVATDNCVTFFWHGIGGGWSSGSSTEKSAADYIWATGACDTWQVHFSDGTEFDLCLVSEDPAGASQWGDHGWKVTTKKTSCGSDGHCCGCCCDQCQAAGGSGVFNANPTGTLGIDPAGQQSQVKSKLTTKLPTFDLGMSNLDKTYLNQTFTFEMPGTGSYQSFTLTLTPDTSTPWGNMIENGRKWVRAMATLALSVGFFIRIWRAVLQVI